MKLESEALGGRHGVRHGFFGRRGGVSEGVWDSLNVGLRSGDRPERIAANRARVAEALGAAPDRLVTARQVHGTTALAVTAPWDNAEAPEADALVTDRPGLLLGVLAADCGPILLADPEAGVIGAAHAGWKGALGGVLEGVVAAMVGLGAAPERITAVLGPCIAQPSYEVGPEFVARFTAQAAGQWALLRTCWRAGAIRPQRLYRATAEAGRGRAGGSHAARYMRGRGALLQLPSRHVAAARSGSACSSRPSCWRASRRRGRRHGATSQNQEPGFARDTPARARLGPGGPRHTQALRHCRHRLELGPPRRLRRARPCAPAALQREVDVPPG